MPSPISSIVPCSLNRSRTCRILSRSRAVRSSQVNVASIIECSLSVWARSGPCPSVDVRGPIRQVDRPTSVQGLQRMRDRRGIRLEARREIETGASHTEFLGKSQGDRVYLNIVLERMPQYHGVEVVDDSSRKDAPTAHLWPVQSGVTWQTLNGRRDRHQSPGPDDVDSGRTSCVGNGALRGSPQPRDRWFRPRWLHYLSTCS